MRHLVFLLLLACASASAAPSLAVDDLGAVPLRRLPADEIQNRIAAARAAQRPTGPTQFAVAQALSADAGDGRWDYPDADTARWRLRVASTDARSLSLRLEHLTLPADAELWFYGRDGADVQGPYSASTVAAADGRLWLPIVRGSEVVLEARLPRSEQGAFSLQVAQAFHGYRALGPEATKSFPSTTGTSSSCEQDAICQSADWGDDLRAVVLVSIDNTYFCSGTLLNNAAQDNRALVLTANHCGLTTGNVAGSRAYFNVQRSGCGGGTPGSVSQNIAGAQLRASTASGTHTDFALFELASLPPAAYGAYYAGWDTGTSAPTSGAAIHHPQADDKKISLFGSPATRQDNVGFEGDGPSGAFTVNTWEVTWSSGLTESGSSGSGLLNQNHRLVGTLSGGSASCTLGRVTGSDYFARLDEAYTASSSTGSSLKQSLDPRSLGCSGIAGRDATVSAVAGCSSATGSPSSGTDSSGSKKGGGGALDAGMLASLLALTLLGHRRRRR